MSDIRLNIETRDFVIENGDMAIIENPSEQNGAVLLYAKNFNLQYPLLGVGIDEVLSGNIQTISTTLDAWKTQVEQDGGEGRWELSTNINTTNVNIDVNYL